MEKYRPILLILFRINLFELRRIPLNRWTMFYFALPILIEEPDDLSSSRPSPALTTQQLVEMIKQVNRTPIERDTLYNVITDYSNYDFSKETIGV